MSVIKRTELDYWVHGGCHPSYNDEFIKVRTWVEENCKGPYTIDEKWEDYEPFSSDADFMGAMISFHNREDAAYFKLTWVFNE